MDGRAIGAVLAAALLCAAPACAEPRFGPFNIDFPQGGPGIARKLPDAPGGWQVGGTQRWSLGGWVELRDVPARAAIVAGVGTPAQGAMLAVSADSVSLIGNGPPLGGAAHLAAGAWHRLLAVSDGARVRLWLDGRVIAEGAPGPALPASDLHLAPRLPGFAPFGGRIMGFAFDQAAIDPQAAHPDPALVTFTNASPVWPNQATNAPGLTTPQDPWTLPTSRTRPSAPVAIPAYAGPPLVARADAGWTLAKWRLAAAPGVAADGAALSRAGYVDAAWYAATVPGTVLTTLVDRGVYPDPGYGLNNMAIPESLARQDYWYRTEFMAPAALPTHPTLTFNGINYVADVWLNGAPLGTVRGAFTRGVFDVTGKLRAGANALAVRIHPPRHPGTVDEESLARGAGFNGGLQALDGPTFFASEGWDWIPGIRDRNSGLWQDVVLGGSGDLRLGDPAGGDRAQRG